MQMFVLDENPYFSAQALADTHVRVICREVSMCLSSWYYKNIGEHVEELPYRPFNHPVIDQLSDINTRKWAILNAYYIFREFERRFNKKHASEEKFNKILEYKDKYNPEMNYMCDSTYWWRAKFSFVEKDNGVIKDLSIHDAVEKYREYYRNKLKTMKVAVKYTNTNKPDWLED